MTVIAIPKILRDKLTDEGADAFVEILDKVEERSQKITLEIVEERFERRIAELKGEITTVKSELEVRIEKVRADIVRWMFIFWAGQIGILFAFFKR